MDTEELDLIVKLSLAEDLSRDYEKDYPRFLRNEDVDLEDVTSDAIFTDEEGSARVYAKSKGVLSGSTAFVRVYRILDPDLEVDFAIKDGEKFERGDCVVRLRGRVRSILAGERTALNFLGHLSGIATEVQCLCSVLGKKKIRILDTRKTQPGLRRLEKEAVVHGGGNNHRMGLYDMVLIKDNHIDRLGSITEAVQKVRSVYGDRYRIEVETRTLAEVGEAAETGVDRIMLDNMKPRIVRKASRIVGRRSQIEVSGNMTRRRIRRLKRSRVDFISAGYITHSAQQSDFTLKIV